MRDPSNNPAATRSADFRTTRWSMVLGAGRTDMAARQALGALVSAYWYPLYAFLRKRGHDSATAEDLTQAFLTDLIERDALSAANPARGRFRSFLLKSLQHFVQNARARERALKRGGGRWQLAIDFSSAETRYLHEPAHMDTPEKLFERRWALTLLDCVLEQLEREYHTQGKQELFAALRPALAGALMPSHAQIGAACGMTADAVKIAAHRLRRRFRDLIRHQIADTVASPADIDDELRHLMTVLS